MHRFDKNIDECFKRLDACLCNDCTLDKRLHYALAYKRHETALARRAEINQSSPGIEFSAGTTRRAASLPRIAARNTNSPSTMVTLDRPATSLKLRPRPVWISTSRVLHKVVSR